MMNYIDEKTKIAFDDVDTELPPVAEYNNEDILIATIITRDEKEKEEMRKTFKNSTITWWHDYSADLVSKDSNKAAGVLKILKHFNINIENPLLHGEAVAIGMWCALWLSVQKMGLDEMVLRDYERKLPVLLSEAQVVVGEQDIEDIMSKLVHDKKSCDGKPQFVLLEALGKPICDIEIEPDMIREALMRCPKLFA